MGSSYDQVGSSHDQVGSSHDQVSEAARSSVDIPGDGEGESLDRPYSPERSPDRDEDMEADDQGALFQPPAVAAGRHVQFNMGPQVPTYGGHRLGGTSQPSLGGVDRLYEATAGMWCVEVWSEGVVRGCGQRGYHHTVIANSS